MMHGTVRYRPVSGRSYSDPFNTVELPYLAPDLNYFQPVGGTLWDCPDSASLMAAIAGATGGDRIKVHAGVRYTLPTVTLPRHGGSRWIYVFVASKLDGTFPLTPSQYTLGGTQTQGQRVGPEHGYAALGASSPLAQFVSPAGFNIFNTECSVGSGGWWFEGIEFMAHETDTVASDIGLISLGSDQSNNIPTALKNIPSYYNFGHCLIHGQPGKRTHRGIAVNASNVAARDCSIYEIHSDEGECVAFGGWNSPGTVANINNFLSAITQEIHYGGASPNVSGLVQRNSITKWSHLWKDPAWFSLNGGRGGLGGWFIKNHFEIKNGTHALVEDCVMENCSADGQDATNILLQALNDNNASPPAPKITDITMRRIKVIGGGPVIALNGYVGYSIHGEPIVLPEQPVSRVYLKDIWGVETSGYRAESGTTYGGGAPGLHGLQIADSVTDAILENMTLEAQTEAVSLAAGSLYGALAARNLKMRNNVLGIGTYGDFTFFASGGLSAKAALDANADPYAIDKNVFYATRGATLSNPPTEPANNGYAANAAAVGFSAYSLSNPGTLDPGSAYHHYGTDGNDPGANCGVLATMATAVRSTTLP